MTYSGDSEQTSDKLKIQHVQPIALMGMAGAFRTTLTAPMEAMFCILPLNIYIRSVARLTKKRLKANHLEIWFHRDKAR